MIQRGQFGPVGDAVIPVYPPGPPADPGQQADVARPGLEPRAAPRPPGAFRAFADPGRLHQQRVVRVGQVPGGGREHLEPELELGVVDLHDRAPFLGTGRCVQVVPGDDAVDTDDAAEAAVTGRHPGGFQHALVVRQLKQVRAAVAGRRAWHGLRRGPAGPVQRRAAGGRQARIGVQAAVVLDVHRPVAGLAVRRYQQVRFADSPAHQVGRQAAAQNQRDGRPHRGHRGCLPGRPVARRDDQRGGVQFDQPGDDLLLELAAPGEPALQDR